MQTTDMKGREARIPVKLLRMGEVAEMLSVHPNTVRKWSDNGLLPSYRFGRRGDRRFMLEDVMRLITVQRVH